VFTPKCLLGGGKGECLRVHSLQHQSNVLRPVCHSMICCRHAFWQLCIHSMLSMAMPSLRLAVLLLPFAPPPKKTNNTPPPHTHTQVTCGHSHSIALDDKGQAYTWGNGNYGKLGHKVGVSLSAGGGGGRGEARPGVF
jgi:hypothetical protein